MKQSKKQLKARIPQLEAFIEVDCDEDVPVMEMTFADLPPYESAKKAMERQVEDLVTRRLEDLVARHLDVMDVKVNRAMNLASRMDGHDTVCRRHSSEIKKLWGALSELNKLPAQLKKLEAKVKKINEK